MIELFIEVYVSRAYVQLHEACCSGAVWYSLARIKIVPRNDRKSY